jgi:transcription elongation factor GreA
MHLRVEPPKERRGMAKPIVLTDEGLKKLEDELEQLKTEKRKEIAEKIKIALSFGDLSENSEYDEAKNEQAMIESRIATLEAMLKNVKLIDDDEISTEVVNLGSKVKVLDVEFNEKIVYYIVGSTEADPDENRISDESPVGKALLGHRVGETVTVEAPGGAIDLNILEITK